MLPFHNSRTALLWIASIIRPFHFELHNNCANNFYKLISSGLVCNGFEQHLDIEMEISPSLKWSFLSELDQSLYNVNLPMSILLFPWFYPECDTRKLASDLTPWTTVNQKQTECDMRKLASNNLWLLSFFMLKNLFNSLGRAEPLGESGLIFYLTT